MYPFFRASIYHVGVLLTVKTYVLSDSEPRLLNNIFSFAFQLNVMEMSFEISFAFIAVADLASSHREITVSIEHL